MSSPALMSFDSTGMSLPSIGSMGSALDMNDQDFDDTIDDCCDDHEYDHDFGSGGLLARLELDALQLHEEATELPEVVSGPRHGTSPCPPAEEVFSECAPAVKCEHAASSTADASAKAEQGHGHSSISLNLSTMQWELPPSGSAHAAAIITKLGRVTAGCLRTIPVKGRQGRDEKETDRRAEEILRARDASGWTVTAETPFEDLECLITVLAKYLETHLSADGTQLWCVGGSLKATLDGRAGSNATNTLRFVRCASVGWTGDRKSKIGNTCKWHAANLDATDVVVGGEYRSRVQLKKCTWIKCCYGKKHYGDPPMIPWCGQCEFQKKLEQKSGACAATGSSKKAAAGGDRISSKSSASMHSSSAMQSMVPTRALDQDVCHDCLHAVVQRCQLEQRFDCDDVVSTCGSCRALLGSVETFAAQLPLPPRLEGGGGAGAASFRNRLKVALVAALARIELKPLLEQVDPILLEALTSRYGMTMAGDLWDQSAEARMTLGRLICTSYGVGSQLHSLLLELASALMAPDQMQLLRTVDPATFLSRWHACLQPLGSPARQAFMPPSEQ
eukprot:SAG11_NODE_1521_length_4755_cov_4.896263_2_plen_561_part_00